MKHCAYGTALSSRGEAADPTITETAPACFPELNLAPHLFPALSYQRSTVYGSVAAVS